MPGGRMTRCWMLLLLLLGGANAQALTIQYQALDLTGKQYNGFPKRLNQVTPGTAALAVAPTGVAYVLGGQLYAVNPNGTFAAGFPKDVPTPAVGEYGLSYNEPTNLVASVTGNLYYTGIVTDQPQSLGNDDVFTQSLNSDGNQRSGFPVIAGTSDYDSSIGVAVDASGSNVWTLWYKDADPIVAYVTRTSAN